MTFDMTPPPLPETSSRSRRQNPSRLASKSADSQLKGQAKSAKDARRRRVELRRIRSFFQSTSVADPPDSSPIDVDQIQNEAIQGASMDLRVERSVRRTSYGTISVFGRPREMDDAVAVELGFVKRGRESYDFFGVFDGREGRRVARVCSQMLHQMLAEIVDEECKKEIEWAEVMVEGFNEVEAKMNENGVAAAAGSAAVVGENEVVVAGSKAVVSRGGVAVGLLDDDKAKGEVRVRVAKRSRADEFLILGSDGFWDVISDEVACQIARRYCDGGVDNESGGAEAAAAKMAELAVARGSKDNVSVILVDLRGADDGIPTSSLGN